MNKSIVVNGCQNGYANVSVNGEKYSIELDDFGKSDNQAEYIRKRIPLDAPTDFPLIDEIIGKLNTGLKEQAQSDKLVNNLTTVVLLLVPILLLIYVSVHYEVNYPLLVTSIVMFFYHWRALIQKRASVQVSAFQSGIFLFLFVNEFYKLF